MVEVQKQFSRVVLLSCLPKEAFSNLDFVQKKEVQHIWKDYKNGNQDNSFYIWQWVNTIATV